MLDRSTRKASADQANAVQSDSAELAGWRNVRRLHFLPWLREVRVRGGKIVRLTVDICEVTTAAAGNENLVAHTVGAFKNCYVAPAFAGLQRAHESGRAGPENQDVIIFD